MRTYKDYDKSGSTNLLDEAVVKLTVKSRSVVHPHKICPDNQAIVNRILLSLIAIGLYKKPVRILKHHISELGLDINLLKDRYTSILRHNKFLFDLNIEEEDFFYRFENFNTLLIFLFYIDFKNLAETTTGNFDFFNKNVSNILFLKTNFKKFNLCHSSIDNSLFYDCCFRGADFENSTETYCGFYKCDFSNTYFRLSDFRYTSFKNIIFRRSKLYGIDFSNSKLENINFSSSFIQDCQFNNTFMNKVVFPKNI